MGVSTDAKLVYGFEVDDESGDAERLAEFMDERYHELETLEKSLGLELVHHCSDECTMYIVGLKETYVHAWRGHPKEVDPRMLAVLDQAAANERLAKCAEALGLEPKLGKWLLCSYWG